jgi:hypothetical protein
MAALLDFDEMRMHHFGQRPFDAAQTDARNFKGAALNWKSLRCLCQHNER